LAAARRFAGFIPYVGDILELITLVFRYHFQFIDASGSSQEVGRYQKTTLFRDHYLLSMSDAAYQSHDWRVLAAMAVALDALQSR
jgi:DNA-binding GntR family transcriptional regulator